MTECRVCGDDVFAYTCRYCNHHYCSDHRLPENHNCPGLALPNDTKRFESGITTTVDTETDDGFAGSISTTGVKAAVKRLAGRDDPAPKSGDHIETGDKSPDVNPDGTIAGGETNINHNSFRRPSRRSKMMRTVRTWGRRFAFGLVVALLVLGVLVALTPFETGDYVDSNVAHEFDNFVSSMTSDSVAVVGQYLPFLTGDNDGDGLYNAQENTSAYPGSSPDHMDLYVRFVVGSEARDIPQSTIEQLERRFAEMPIENPDGATGIDLHVVAVNETNRSLTPHDAPQSIADVFQYVPAYNGSVGCDRLHTVAVTEYAGTFYSGQGQAPGLLSYVDRTPGVDLESDRLFVQLVIHELLHNIVGERLPADESVGGVHTYNGYLSRQYVDYHNQMYLSSVTRRVLADGFAKVENSDVSC